VSKGEDSKREIVASALAMASELGLEGVTIGLLAERTGRSKSGLFAHFGSKEELQVAILDEAVDRFVSLVVTPALKQRRGLPRVRALFDLWLQWAQSDFMPGGCIFVAATVELDDRPGPARDRLVSSEKDWLSVLAGAAKIAVEEGHFREDLDCEQFAFELYSIAHGYHTLARLFRDRSSDKRARAAFERLVRDATTAHGTTHDTAHKATPKHKGRAH
jgi:AcrR family transcriptional regulator